jgi:Fe-S cluster biogenesis protein NfuA
MTQDAGKQEIRILAQPAASGESCSFVMYPPLYEGVTASFVSKEEAEGSPLAEMLFALPGVNRVLVAPNKLTVFHRGESADWSQLGKQVGQIIRQHHASGRPAVSDAVRSRIDASMDLAEKVRQVLDTEINPAVAMHGGFISLLEVKGTDVYLQMGGGCQGCAMSKATLKQGVETALRQHIPDIGHIYDTTDHASGANPYYHGG